MQDWSNLEHVFSKARLGRYLKAFNNDKEKAQTGYIYNLKLSESLLVPLSVLEITLRNAMSRQMARLYNRDDWYEAVLTDPALHLSKPVDSDKTLQRLYKSIRNAKRDAKSPNLNKVIAEFSFGFWTTLLNTRYQRIFWSDLSFAFSNCPGKMPQRNTVSRALNQIRDLRNRVFHHEPILWTTPSVQDHHQHIYNVLSWMSPNILLWLQEIDRFPSILMEFSVGHKSLNN